MTQIISFYKNHSTLTDITQPLQIWKARLLKTVLLWALMSVASILKLDFCEPLGLMLAYDM